METATQKPYLESSWWWYDLMQHQAKLPCLFVRSVTLSDAVFFYFFSMKDNVHPSPSFNCCSWGSLSGLESLWIWHRKPGLSRVLFLLPPRLLPFALCNSAVIRAKRSGFWSLPCGHCNNPKSMVRKEETVVLLNKPIFYGKYKVDALAPTWPNLYFLQHKSQ